MKDMKSMKLKDTKIKYFHHEGHEEGQKKNMTTLEFLS